MAIIDKPSDYFNTKLYTGTGATHNVTGVGFQPDLVWIKQRNGTRFHRLIDSVRGATKELYSNSTDSEIIVADGLTSFDSNGFTLGSGIASNGSGDTLLDNADRGGIATSGSMITLTIASTTSDDFDENFYYDIDIQIILASKKYIAYNSKIYIGNLIIDWWI